MIMVRPDRKASLSVMPRHRMRPFQIGGPSLRIELFAHRRMDAVGRDQQCAIMAARRFAGRLVDEFGAHAVSVSVQPER